MAFRYCPPLTMILIAVLCVCISTKADAAPYSLEVNTTENNSAERISRPPEAVPAPTFAPAPELLQKHPLLAEALKVSGTAVPPDLDNVWRDSSKNVILAMMNTFNYSTGPLLTDTVPPLAWLEWRNRLDYFFTYFLTQYFEGNSKGDGASQNMERYTALFNFDVTADGHIVDLVAGSSPEPASLFARCQSVYGLGPGTNTPSLSPLTEEFRRVILTTDGNPLWWFPTGSRYQRVHMLFATREMPPHMDDPLGYLDYFIHSAASVPADALPQQF